MNWQSIPIPKKMRALARDRRGYPVPFIILRDTDGRPHYTINDTVRVQRCIRERRCQICGGKIDGPMWFVGGPQSAFHPAGAYLDTALHHDCMTYAMQVCPYLAARNYDGRIDTGTMDLDKVPGEYTIFRDYTMIPERPVLFVAVGTMKSEAWQSEHHPEAVMQRPLKPWTGVEFWQQGQKLDDETGRQLVIEALKSPSRLTPG